MRIVTVAKPELGAIELHAGHPVKSMSWDPLDAFLAATCKNGSVVIYDISNAGDALASSGGGTLRPIKTLEAVKFPDDASQAYFSTVEFPVAWHPTGGVLAFGTDAGATVLRRGGSWDTVYALTTPTAVRPQSTVDAWSGSEALVWSPNGRFLAAVDSRRLLTVWDVTAAAHDAHTGLPTLANAATGAGEPAVALNGHVPRPGEDDDASRSATTEVRLGPPGMTYNTYPRPCAVAWPLLASGAAPSLLLLDLEGVLMTVKIGALLQDGTPAAARTHGGGESAAEALAEPPSWPLLARPPRAADATTAASTAAGGVAAVRAAAAAATSRLIRPPPAGGGYGDAEAGEDNDDIDDDDDVELEAIPGASSGAAASARQRPGETRPSGEDDPLELSVAAIARSHGYVNDDDEGGPRLLADAGRGGTTTAGDGAVESMIESGRFVTVDALESHTIATGRYIREVYGLVAPQAPFQSGSSSFSARGGARRGARRYLQWNAVGAITLRAESGGGGAIDIDFADTAFRSVHFSEAFPLAALGVGGALFAAPYVPPRTAPERDSALDQGTPALLYYVHVGTASGNEKPWRLDFAVHKPRLPAHSFARRDAGEVAALSGPGRRRGGGRGGDDASEPGTEEGVDAEAAAADDEDDALVLDTSAAAESPVALAVGDGWCAAATDAQLLRFFRSSGVQEAPVALAGAPVTVAGHGALAAVAYHRAAPSGWAQHLAVDVFLYKGAADGTAGPTGPVAQPRRVLTVDLPLRPHTTLAWLSFSSRGQLLALDSDGVMFALQAGLGPLWTPVMDTRALGAHGGAVDGGRRRGDWFWPVCVVDVPVSALAGSSSADAEARVVVGKTAPALMAVLCKGGSRAPAVTAPRPLTTALPLDLPLLGGAAPSALDNAVVRGELSRLHSGWVRGLGLSHVDASPLALSAALSAAAAELRGSSVGSDPAETITAAEEAVARENDESAKALDRVLVRAIHEACEEERDARAVQLATRLHNANAFSVAGKAATKQMCGAVAQRITQLGAVRALRIGGGDGTEALDAALAQVHAATSEAAAAAAAALAAASSASSAGEHHDGSASARADGSSSKADSAAPPMRGGFGIPAARAAADRFANESSAPASLATTSSAPYREPRIGGAAFGINPFARPDGGGNGDVRGAAGGSPVRRKRDRGDAFEALARSPAPAGAATGDARARKR